MFSAETLVLPFNRVGIEAIASVGGKNASLGEMIRELAEQGVRVPGALPLRQLPTASCYAPMA